MISIKVLRVVTGLSLVVIGLIGSYVNSTDARYIVGIGLLITLSGTWYD